MIEVEAKVRISNVAKVRKAIKKIGKYKGREKKVDDYYTLESLGSYPKESLRIRKRQRFYEVNFKKKISYLKGVHAKEENEFRVSDIKGVLALIDEFGFKKWLRKEKTTETYMIKKNFNIEINKVKGLGYFLEVEYLSEEKGIKKARAEVVRVMKELGIDKKEIVKDGYTKMLWNKKK